METFEADLLSSDTGRTAAEIELSEPSISIPVEQISQRAYELFLERGGTHGADLDDWLRAERDLAGRVES